MVSPVELIMDGADFFFFVAADLLETGHLYCYKVHI